MSYNSIAAIQQDNDLRMRLTACAAIENADQNPWGWVDMNMWKFAAQPGWGDTYAPALAAYDPENPGTTPSPGKNEEVITDNMILTAVQSLMPPVTPPETPSEPEGEEPLEPLPEGE